MLMIAKSDQDIYVEQKHNISDAFFFYELVNKITRDRCTYAFF